MRIAELPESDSIGSVHDNLPRNSLFKDGHDAAVVLRVLASARDWPGTTLSVFDLRLIRRDGAPGDSFTAWST